MSSSSDDLSAMSFDDYLLSLLIPSEEIESATNNFSDENFITQGSSFTVYKGQLLLQSGELVDIVARKCLQKSIGGHEVTFSQYLRHTNIVSLFKCTITHDGFCVIVNKHEANGSLDKHISSPTLTWMRRLRICVGVARAMCYLHYDAIDGAYVIHGNIKSSKILLDHNWEPKLHGLGFVVMVGKHLAHTTTKYNGSLQYMDPAYEITGGLTNKSDVFSFGVLLFEVLFGREASIPNNDNWYFARLARSHYEDGKLDDLIDSGLRNQMNWQSLNLFAETAYWCIKEQRSQRPDMNQLLRRLERALELQHKHEHPTTAFEVEGTSSDHLKGKNLDYLKLRFSDIELATNNFSKTFCLGSGGYGMVYKADLDHFNGIDSSTIEGENEGILRMKHSTVAIKRLFTREDEQGEKGFVAEIETLSNCKHPNVVSLLGFCDERSELILIYEYVTNGSLAGYLGNSDTMINLTWDQRLQICLNIAHGLSYLHAFTDDKPMIVHRDIKSENILLDDNWVAKIADFGLSKLHANRQVTTLVTNNIAGTEVYLDPEYLNTGKLKKESDIYSFGVVMFEILCGRLAYDKIYGEKGLASIVRQRFNEGTLEEMVDPRLKEADETVSMLIGGVNQDSLSTFLKIANQCLAETQSGRPTMEVIINELEKSSNLQKNNLQVSLKAIEAGTQNFSDNKCVGEGRFWKLYEGEVALANRGCTEVLAKRWESKSRQAHNQFLTELHILYKYKHKNVIGFVGYVNELGEKIMVYEHASNRRLDKHLDNHSLTWMKRLKICTDVVVGLEFLHDGVEDPIMHGDIRSGSILLDADWNAKISNMEWSRSCVEVYRSEHLDDNAFYSLGYMDPEYQTDGYFSQKSDIFSIGVILVEMLCGRLAWANGCEDHSQSLGPLVVIHHKEKGNLYEMIFEGIKEQIAPQSLTTFQGIALQCLENKREDRPDISDVVIQLKKALTFQEDYEIWEPKLPIDYKEIIHMSKNPDMYDSVETKMDLYHTFCNGILLQDGKVWFSLGSNGVRNEMISAKRFSYKYHSLPKWRSLPESRFRKVAEMLNISNLKIHIKIRTQLLSLHVNYKVHLIFKFCGPRKSQAKQMYVNLKYIMGNECLNAYFAKWRDDGWMTIELFQFLNQKKDTDFEVVLESLSRCYCGNDSIYIEGILFQAIDNASLQVKHEEMGGLNEVKQVLKSESKMDKMKVKKYHMTWFALSQIKRKKDETLSAKNVVYNSSNVPIQYRFDGVIELPRQQVLHIKCKIKSQMLEPNKVNVCYLVFKLSARFRGLHGPVIVRDLSNWRSKETRILYFRSPNMWNVDDPDWVPKRRKDGWMEVLVWKFDSNYQLESDHLFVNLKLVTYEGTMSGLIVRGIHIRSV